MKAPDLIAPLLYMVFMALLLAKYKTSQSWKNIFALEKKTIWLISSASLIIYGISAETGQLYTGLIYNNGLWGLWFILVTMSLGAGFIPVVFSGLWAKMGFITDNQFLLFRFSGRGSRILHKFRAIYVGIFIVSIVLSFQIVAFGRILQYFLLIPYGISLALAGLFLVLFSVKNIYNIKLKRDLWQTGIYLGSFIVAWIFISAESGGIAESLSVLSERDADLLQLWPEPDNRVVWNSLLVFFGVQWWSTQVLDGSGPEAQRLRNTRGKWGPLMAGLAPSLANIILGFFMISFILMGMAQAADIPAFSEKYSVESSFVGFFIEFLPAGIKGLALVGFFAAFITTAETRLNWGASFVMIDLYKTYLNPHANDQKILHLSILTMVLMSLLAIIFAWWGKNLEFLFKLMFSMGAGVGPVFLLRWFWLRINAWSQLSAMLSSAFYTITFMNIAAKYPEFENFWLQTFSLNLYSAQIITVTVITSITWLTVTFLTPPDTKECLENYRKILPPSFNVIRQVVLALLVGVALAGMWYLALLFFSR